jgi:type IV pilus assembly protein PilN
MIRINLLPFRAARKKENIKRQVMIFLLTFILVAAGIYFYNSSLNKKIEKLNDNIAFTQEEINRYKKITMEIAKIKSELDILNKKIAVINGLERNRKEPLRLLDAMTRLVIAKRMWFTSFSSKDETVNTNGIALDNKTVADFMTRLQDSKLFSSVNLKSLRKQTMNNVSLKGFVISCVKAPLAEPSGKGGKK